MADTPDSKQESFSTADGIQTSLVRARDLIVQIIDGVANSPSIASLSGDILPITPLQNEQQRVPNVSDNNTNLHNRALEEHRRLFGFSPQFIGCNTSQTGEKRSRGKGGKYGKSSKLPKVATWTHAFICLAKKSQVTYNSFF